MKQNIKFFHHIEEFQGLKKDLKALSSMLRNVERLNSFRRELRGIKDVDESSTVCMMVGSTRSVRDEQGWLKKSNDLFDFVRGKKVTLELLLEVAQKVKEIQDDHMPIEDNRQTQEEYDKKNLEAQETRKVLEARAKEKLDRFLAEFADSSELISIPEGQRAVILKVTYDNSDVMTDYFDSHASIGVPLLLGIIPKGREDESSLRRVLERFEELKNIAFSWHTQKYSMGHGNFLDSVKTQGTITATVYRTGVQEVGFSFEIRHDSYTKAVRPFRGYLESAKQTEHESIGSIEPTGIQVTRNPDKNGIEVKFPGKPELQVLSALKENRFRWHRGKKIWYARETPATLELIKSLGIEASQ